MINIRYHIFTLVAVFLAVQDRFEVVMRDRGKRAFKRLRVIDEDDSWLD